MPLCFVFFLLLFLPFFYLPFVCLPFCLIFCLIFKFVWSFQRIFHSSFTFFTILWRFFFLWSITIFLFWFNQRYWIHHFLWILFIWLHFIIFCRSCNSLEKFIKSLQRIRNLLKIFEHIKLLHFLFKYFLNLL